LEALARLGKGQVKIPKWKLQKLQAKGTPVNVNEPAQVKIREAIETITVAADQLRKYLSSSSVHLLI